MREIEKPFDVQLGSQKLRVSEYELAGKRVFHVDFGTGEKPLVITVGINTRDQKFWTSIPQGRQKEATEIGKLIAEHIRAKNK